MMKTHWLPAFFFLTFSLWLPLAHCASVTVMRCRGRPSMTLSQTDHGLITELWADQFQVAQGYENTYLPDGDLVRLYRFRNGDLWFRDMKNGRDFFSYAGQDVLEPCTAGQWYPLPAITPPRWEGE